ncbi:hypothetical protein [Burkholderia vietnamiensis]|uniref:hypothetical protein n=1 Tax=Burkholderia vietnamiensis TaxID=60552 RepID=UPI002656333D|nr:hypothetical protein [Burkholderia vietnamiensis]MDN7668270.1 hypothetical protein [Burkholderia vietnamiensis]
MSRTTTPRECTAIQHRTDASQTARDDEATFQSTDQFKHAIPVSHRWPWPPAVEDAIRTLGTLADRQRQTR